MKDLIPTDTQSTIQNTLDWCESIKDVGIFSDQDLQNADEITRRIKAKVKELDDARKFLVTPYNEKVKEINAVFKKPINLLEGLAYKFRNAMGMYHKEQQKIADEKQRKLEEQKRKEKEELRKNNWK